MQQCSQTRDHNRLFFFPFFFCFGVDVVLLFFTQSETLSTVALGCHCRSQGAIFSPSRPVIGRDGCIAALLQNMSRAGEGEVGVESRKGQRPRPSPYMSSCSHTLWHPSHAAGALKQVVTTATNKEIKSFLKCICLFLKCGSGVCVCMFRGGGGVWL